MKYLPQEKPGSGHSGYQQQVKEANIKRIFDLVRSGKCKSRAEIVRHMNLSATSVSVLVEELANRKLIDETGPAQTTLPGRRPISLRLNKSAHHMAVFVVKPEGVRFALLSLECRILEERFFPLDCRTLNGDNAGEAYIQLFDDILRNRSKRFNPSRAVMIGVCFPGMYIEQDHLFHTEPALGYALTEDFPLRDGVPQARYGTLGLLRAPQIPDIHAIYVEREELLPVAYGAKGIGEIAAIPTAPALQGAYYALDGIFRTKLPMEKTWYKK